VPAGIKPLDKQAALVELVRHSYLSNNLPPNAAAAHLRQCADVLGHVGLSQLQRTLSLPDLPTVSQMVEAGVAANPSRSTQPAAPPARGGSGAPEP
jgi:hypothetical protein